MLSQVVINQGNFALQNRAENVVQTVVHCFSITSSNKLIINKIIPLSQSPLGSQKRWTEMNSKCTTPTISRYCRSFSLYNVYDLRHEKVTKRHNFVTNS